MYIFPSRHERNVNFRRLFLWPIITVIKKALETCRELWLKYSLTCSIINAELTCYMKCLWKKKRFLFLKEKSKKLYYRNARQHSGVSTYIIELTKSWLLRYFKITVKTFFSFSLSRVCRRKQRYLFLSSFFHLLDESECLKVVSCFWHFKNTLRTLKTNRKFDPKNAQWMLLV